MRLLVLKDYTDDEMSRTDDFSLAISALDDVTRFTLDFSSVMQ